MRKQVCLNCGHVLERMIPDNEKSYKKQGGELCPSCNYNGFLFPSISNLSSICHNNTLVMWREIRKLQERITQLEEESNMRREYEDQHIS